MRSSLLLLGAAAAMANPTPAGPGGPPPPHPPPSPKPFEYLVTFGDSWTDNGRLVYYIVNNGQAPPPGQMHDYSNVTASGGLSWAQFAANSVGAQLRDYAVSGAVCSNQIVERYFSYIGRSFPAVLDDEIPSFQADVNYRSLYPNRNAQNTVYALWIGTNDLGFDAFLSDSEAPGKTIADFVECAFNVFDAIYQKGGRRFVLLNTAPLELTPLYAHPKNGGTGDSQFWTTKTRYNMTEYGQKIKQYSSAVNQAWKYGLAFHRKLSNRWAGATIDLFDVHQLFRDIIANPTSYLDAPYNVTGYWHHCPPSGSPCEDLTSLGPRSGFLWYDELHPSDKTSMFPWELQYIVLRTMLTGF